jgi:hypothetical protein
MTDPHAHVSRKLDEIVGTTYEEPKAGRVRKTLVKWLVGAVCALGAVTTIVWVIEAHRLPKEIPQRAAKPVTVTIVPAKKAQAE